MPEQHSQSDADRLREDVRRLRAALITIATAEEDVAELRRVAWEALDSQANHPAEAK